MTYITIHFFETEFVMLKLFDCIHNLNFFDCIRIAILLTELVIQKISV